jgi:hypothetical protein
MRYFFMFDILCLTGIWKKFCGKGRSGWPRHPQPLGHSLLTCLGAAKKAEHPVAPSWKDDEIYIKIKGQWVYL